MMPLGFSCEANFLWDQLKGFLADAVMSWLITFIYSTCRKILWSDLKGRRHRGLEEYCQAGGKKLVPKTAG